MKAITIHQPWATLIALGEKRFETRSWATKYRGPIAIHAGKSVDKEACESEPIKSTLAKHGYTTNNLPTGAIVAICNLTGCFESAGSTSDRAILHGKIEKVEGNEWSFGDLTIGRYAWELTNVRKIEPIPAKGQQRIWNWDGNGY